MAYFAEIGQNDIVIRVIVADSKEWCEQNLGGEWVETHKNVNGRNYAGKGFTYVRTNGNFCEKKPDVDFILDKNCKWQPPVPDPKNGRVYDKETKKWDTVDNINKKILKL